MIAIFSAVGISFPLNQTLQLYKGPPRLKKHLVIYPAVKKLNEVELKGAFVSDRQRGERTVFADP